MRTLKEIAYNGNQIELQLSFTTKELTILQSFLQIFECYAQKGVISQQKLIVYLNKLHDKKKHLEEGSLKNTSTCKRRIQYIRS